MKSILGYRVAPVAPKLTCRVVALITLACCAWMVTTDVPARSAVPVSAINSCDTAVGAMTAGLTTLSRSQLALRAAVASKNKPAVKRAKKRVAEATAQRDAVRAKIKTFCATGAVGALSGGCSVAIGGLATTVEELVAARELRDSTGSAGKNAKVRTRLKRLVRRLELSVAARSEAMRAACTPQPGAASASTGPAQPLAPAKDTRAPIVTIAVQTPTSDTTPTVQLSADEPGVTIACALDGGPSVEMLEAFETATLAEGAHALSCQGTDTAANTGSPSIKIIVVDLTPPGTTIIAGPASTTTTTLTHSVYLAAAGNSAECRVDGGGFSLAPGGSTTNTYAAGPHVLACRLIDAAGNRGPIADFALTILP